MKDKLSEQQSAAILKALEEALENGPWVSSNFLGVIGKNLRELRDNLAFHLSGAAEKSRIESTIANRVALRAGQQEIFISLYSTEGSSLQAWERLLMNLPRQIISRPIYADEENVKTLIKAKENKINEAYVAIYVNRDDILAMAPDKVIIDKLGNPLISLKDRALNLEHVSRFVHHSGVYDYIKGRLTKNAQSE